MLLKHNHTMKYKQTATRFARMAPGLGATVLAVTAFAGFCHAEDAEPDQRPQPAPTTDTSIPVGTYETGYWTGEYWDAQKGSSFWHNLIPGRSNASNPTGDNTANGSKRVRDQQRARARAAAKAQR